MWHAMTTLPAPSIRRHVSRMQGVLALGKIGDATFESSYPLAGSLADLSESLAKFGDLERHQALCALLHLLPSEAAGDLVPQIVSILEADVFDSSPPAEPSLQRHVRGLREYGGVQIAHGERTPCELSRPNRRVVARRTAFTRQ